MTSAADPAGPSARPGSHADPHPRARLDVGLLVAGLGLLLLVGTIVWGRRAKRAAPAAAPTVATVTRTAVPTPEDLRFVMLGILGAAPGERREHLLNARSDFCAHFAA